MTYAAEELTPHRLALEWDKWKRAEAEAMKTRGEISLARTRLHDLENHLTRMEEDRHGAARFLEAYFLAKGAD